MPINSSNSVKYFEHGFVQKIIISINIWGRFKYIPTVIYF